MYVDVNGAETILLTILGDYWDNGASGVIVGRNMNLPLSFFPAAVFHTKRDGTNTYDIINIAMGRFS